MRSGRVVYGVTTGFGNLMSVSIAPDDAAQLQLNLLRSHAVGSGPPLPEPTVRAMVALLAASLRRGRSGVRLGVVELLLAMLERGVVPAVPSRGSVGSSGDLAPLAHLGLVLVGEGEATYGGERLPGGEALARAGLEPVVLGAKEGLALINGTHLMAAAGGLAARAAARVLDAAVVAVALSLEAFKGSTVPFDARLHEVRGQPGPARVAAKLRELLAGSPVVASHADCGRVQDPYTLRCAPQVLGAAASAAGSARSVRRSAAAGCRAAPTRSRDRPPTRFRPPRPASPRPPSAPARSADSGSPPPASSGRSRRSRGRAAPARAGPRSRPSPRARRVRAPRPGRRRRRTRCRARDARRRHARAPPPPAARSLPSRSWITPRCRRERFPVGRTRPMVKKSRQFRTLERPVRRTHPRTARAEGGAATG